MGAQKKLPVAFEELVQRVSKIVSDASGIRLGEKQQHMVETRLRRRMLQLGIKDPEDYRQYLDANASKEKEALLSLLTTHHSFFFREFTHFNVLRRNMSDLCRNAKQRGDNTIRIWSAACSRGQEVYSIAMFMDYYLPRTASGFTYEILGSDIDPQSVSFAENGVYRESELKTVPSNFLGRHWAKGKEGISEYVKAKKTLREKCLFKTANILDIPQNIHPHKFDIIFCRNVFIYFEEEQVRKIAESLLSHLHESGVLVSGISESLGHFRLNVESIGAAIYKKKAGVEAPPEEPKLKLVPKVETPPAIVEDEDKVLRVVSVDDSPPILMLLKRIFAADEKFELVATAKNGLEAKEVIEQHKPDLVTMDIHMPKMDGLTYLSSFFSGSHPPVVVVSSASRDDSDVSIRALELGAADFVEKPSLNNLEERSDEIKTKLIVAYETRDDGKKLISSFDKSLSRKYVVEDPHKKLRVLVASMAHLEKMTQFFRELHTPQPPAVILFEGNENVLPAIKATMDKQLSEDVTILDEVPESLELDAIYLADFNKVFETLQGKFGTMRASCMIFGNCAPKAAEKIMKWEGLQLLVEDLGSATDALGEVANDIVPVTSFVYLSNKFLAEG